VVYTLRFFSLQNAVCFIILTYLVLVLFTFYIHGVLKLKKKNNSGAKRLNIMSVCILTLSYLACNAQAPRYTDIWSLSGCILKFSTFSHERRDIGGGWGGGGKGITEHKTSYFIFSATFSRDISRSNKKSSRYYHKYTCLHVKYTLFLSHSNEYSIFCFFSTEYRTKIIKYRIS